MNRKNTQQTLLHNLWFSIGMCYSASAKLFFIKTAILILNSMLPIANLLLWKYLLNNILNIKIQYFVFVLVVYFIVRLTGNFINIWDAYINRRYADEMHIYIDNIMIDKIAKMDLSFFESAEMGDKIRQIRQNFDYIKKVEYLVFNFLTKIFSVSVSLMAIVSIKWWLPFIIMILSIPNNIYNYMHTNKLYNIEKEQTRDKRKLEYYSQSFYNKDMQFEFKLNRTGEIFIEKYKLLWKQLYRKNRLEIIKNEFYRTLFSGISLISDCIVWILSINLVIAGYSGIGDIQYNLRMGNRFKNQSNTLISEIVVMLTHDTKINELRDFLSIQPHVEQGGTLIPSNTPIIEFCNVSFKYPNSQYYILRDCSFCINSNEKVSFVGANGSGKSTILKLLFRFYVPDSGVIKIDGVNIEEYNIYELRKKFGIVFQDQVMYCLPLREIISLPRFEQRNNDNALYRASVKSGFDNVIREWNEGYDSILGRYYADNGKDLSNGQWKVLSITRAYFQECNYMICDEPSASLDPLSEHQIFLRLLELSENNNLIIVSHQMANTALSDKIFVVSDGHITEQGSHEELLKMDGLYAHYYHIQASKYT